jgi:hypothetical protein
VCTSGGTESGLLLVWRAEGRQELRDDGLWIKSKFQISCSYIRSRCTLTDSVSRLCVEAVVKADELINGEECWISNGVRGFQFGKVKLSQS